MSKKIELNWRELDACLQYKSSLRVCSDVTGVSPATIKRKLREVHDMTFAEYADTKLSRTKLNLVQTAVSMALEKHPTMLIFCLKNICHWADKIESTDELKQTLTVNYNLDKTPEEVEKEALRIEG